MAALLLAPLVAGADAGIVAKAVRPTLVERNGMVAGYATGIGFFNHTVAESNDDLKALIAAAPEFGGPGFLLPSRNSEVLRWCLNEGLRVAHPLSLMSLGLYNEPRGAFCHQSFMRSKLVVVLEPTPALWVSKRGRPAISSKRVSL